MCTRQEIDFLWSYNKTKRGILFHCMHLNGSFLAVKVEFWHLRKDHDSITFVLWTCTYACVGWTTWARKVHSYVYAHVPEKARGWRLLLFSLKNWVARTLSLQARNPGHLYTCYVVGLRGSTLVRLRESL